MMFHFYQNTRIKFLLPILLCSLVILAFIPKSYAVYCVPSHPACSTQDNITSVSLLGTTLNNSGTGCTSLNGPAYSIYPPFANLTGTVQPGNTYQLSVTSDGSCIISVWIDYNLNQVFEASEWTQVTLASTANVALLVNITIPINATSGIAGMRIRSRLSGIANGAIDACTAFGSGETEDYSLTIASASACTAPPAAGTTVSSNTQVCANEQFTLSLSGASSGTGISYQWEMSTNNLTWLPIAGATFSSQTMGINTANYFRCAVTCSGITSYSLVLYVSVNSPTQCYCSSAPIYNSLSDIGRVILGSMTNGTAYPITLNSTAINTYTDFTSVSPTSLNQGAYYPMCVQQVTSGTVVNNAVVVVYLDFNHDGIFSYPSEYTYLGATTNAGGANVVVNQLFIQGTATLGLTRMRVILSENGATNQPACGTYYFGETEDYLVNIISPQICVAPVNAGNAATSTSTVCGQNPFTLSLIGATSNSTVSYLWQYSANNINWYNMVGGTSSIFTTFESQSLYYRCAVTCSGTTSYSTPIYVANTPLAQCYCNSNATNANYTDIGNVTIGSLSNGVASPVLNNTAALNSYTNFTALPAPTLYKGITYPISVSQILSSNTFFSAYALVYIDFNQDGLFSYSETFGIDTTTAALGGNTVNSSITIPLSALSGTTRMRVILVENGNLGQSSCGTYGYGETEDYNVTITVSQPCTIPPAAGVSTSTDSLVCSSTQFTLNLSGNSSGIGQTYTWQSSTNLISWQTISASLTNPAFTSSQSQATYYRCLVICSGFSAYSASVYINQKGVLSCYCNSIASSSLDSDIGNVSIGSLNNGNPAPIYSNPNANHGFTDFTGLTPTNLQLGGSYLLSVSQITSGTTFYNAYVNAFIDFNGDGNFGTGESFLIGQTSSIGSQFNVSAYVQVPVNAILGASRMRIVLSEATSVGPCASYGYGETEDYTVNFVPAQSCPFPLLGGNAVSSLPSVCPGVPLTLSLTGNSVVPTATYIWQYSYDGIAYFQVAGFSNATFTLYQNAATFYRCLINCSGNLVYSTPVYVPMTVATQCYCTSSALNSGIADIGNVSIGTLNNGLASPAINNSNAVNTYTNFTGLPAVSLEVGTLYPVSVAQISLTTFNTSYVTLYIDFNQNGIFEVPSESYSIGQTTTALGGNVLSTYISIPANATLGLTRMRVVLQVAGSATQLPCSTYVYGETEDYMVNLIPAQGCSIAPIAGNAIANDTNVCLMTSVNLSLQNNTTYPSQTYQWQYSSDNINWVNQIGATYPTLTITFYTALYYRCTITCSGNTSSSTSVHVTQAASNQCYCVSSATNTADDDIGNVTFGFMNNGVAVPAINNVTSNNLYTDFTSLTPQNVILGASYPISVTQINSAGFFTCHLTAYIDFNQNGVFDTGSETIVLGTTNNSAGGNTITGTIVIPFTALPGITRMRLVLVEGTGATPTPCGTYTWGETEDYSLLILQNQSCAVAPNAGISNSSSTSVCQNAPFTLFLTGNSSALGQYFQWQSSSDGITWNNLGSISLDSSFIFSQTSTMYYRCAVTCSGLTSYSIPVLVNMLQSPICGYCTNIGGTSCPSNTKITNVTLAGTSLNNSDTLCYSINGSAVGVFPYGGNTTAVLTRGNGYFISVTSTQNVSKSVWIDYDQSGTFTPNEWTQICATSTAGIPDTAQISIPFGIPPGPTGMRIRTRINGTPNGAGDACSFFGSGETEDYTVLIDIGTGVSGVNPALSMHVFPNPAKDWLTVKISNNLVNGTLYLRNTLGEIVLSKNIVSTESILFMHDLPVGIYFLNYKTQSENLHLKVVKE